MSSSVEFVQSILSNKATKQQTNKLTKQQTNNMNATKTNNNKKFTKRQMTKAERAAIVAKKKAEKEHRKQEYNKKQQATKTVSSKEASSYFTCLDSESDADSEEKVKPMTLVHPDVLEYKYDPTRRWADMVDSSDDDN